MRTTNTGEPYIILHATRPGESYYHVFTSASLPGRTGYGMSRYFPATQEGFGDAIIYRDAVLAGELTPEPRRQLDPGPRPEGYPTEHITIARQRDPALPAYRRQELGDYCEWPGCVTPEAPARLKCAWTDGAHRNPLAEGERLSTWEDYVLLCPNHHRVFDNYAGG